MTDFHVGQQVVCVDDGPARDGYQPQITRGLIYTVTAVRGPNNLGRCGVLLREAPPAKIRPGFSEFYFTGRFRPIRKTDISVFERLLTKAPEVVS